MLFDETVNQPTGLHFVQGMKLGRAEQIKAQSLNVLSLKVVIRDELSDQCFLFIRATPYG
jgi:hypothetical protein